MFAKRNCYKLDLICFPYFLSYILTKYFCRYTCLIACKSLISQSHDSNSQHNFLKFKSSMRIRKKWDSSDFECGRALVPDRLIWIFPKLQFHRDFPTQAYLGFTQNVTWINTQQPSYTTMVELYINTANVLNNKCM